MSDYRELEVWRKAHEIPKLVDRIVRRIRSSHYSYLRLQLSRAALSVPANIVEGSSQETAANFCRFLGYSINSANEVEYHARIAHEFGLVGAADYRDLTSRIEEVRRMLYGLRRYLKSRSGRPDTSAS